MRVFHRTDGNAILATLVLAFVMTLLGLALLDLGLLENRLATASYTERRAFEIAQAGLERALDGLQRTMVAEEGLGLAQGWHNGSTEAGATTPMCEGGCVATEFRLVNTTTPYLANFGLNHGQYAIAFKLLTVTEAGGNPYGQSCRCPNPDPVTGVCPGADLCADLIFVRSTGTLAGPPAGYTASRTIQSLVRAVSTSVFAGGITAGSPSGSPLHGNVKVAGSIHIIGDPGTAAIVWGGGAGQRNNWAELDAASLARLTPLPLVCPPGRSCSTDTNRVESLSAELRVALPKSAPAVTLSGSADLGQGGDSASYGVPARRGKGPLDGIRVADGCAMPCTDNFSGVSLGSNTFVDGDNLTKPYPGTPPAFPVLTDPTAVAGGTPPAYEHYACVHGSSCHPGGTALPAGEFFLNHAYQVGAAPATDGVLSASLGSATGLRDDTAGFRVPVTWVNKAGTAVVGEVCWRRESLPLALRGGSLPPPDTLEFGVGTCETATPPSNPMLLYMNYNGNANGFTIDRHGGPVAYNYRGAAIVLTTGVVKIEEALQTVCTTPAGSPPCAGARFPEHQLLAVLTPNRMEIGKSNANIDRVMGLFYTSADFYSEKQTNIVGTITAHRFCFAGGGCPLSAGGNVPSFFQVPDDMRRLPSELFHGSGAAWTVSPVARFWLECRGDASPVVPPTVSGVCGYQ
jgi:hypothetical protein